MTYMHLDVPTTYAPYKEVSKFCPWCNIHHTCPSNIAWVTFKDDPKKHLVPRAWIEDKVALFPPGALATGNIRSDGMIWTAFRSHTLCYTAVPIVDADIAAIADVQIGAWRHECCLECWEKRW